MKLAPESLGVIQDALSEYLSHPTFGDAEFARSHSALPLYGGWAGTTYLTTAGEFWFLDFDVEPPRIESDLNESAKVVALVAASENHPRLAELLPSRPATAADCALCSGRGQITVPKRSKLICGQCSGLGWIDNASERQRSNRSYPTFDVALAQLRAFAKSQRFEGDITFVSFDHALLIKDRLFLKMPEASEANDLARGEYESAVARRLGVCLGVLGTLPDGTLGAYVYGPSTLDEAERLMYPNGLKLSVPVAQSAVSVVSALGMWLLRGLYGRRARERTRLCFK